MTSISDEIELLARLEIEIILENNQLGKFADNIERIFEFPMQEIISEYFVEGAKFGTIIDHTITELDKELFMVSLNEKMRYLLQKSQLHHTDETKALELFEKLFMHGMYWTIRHQANEESN